MTRVLLVAVVVLCLVSCTHGVPACPEPVVVRQRDGTSVRIHLKGDEFFHWHEDDTGYPILQSPAGVWVYARLDRGGLVPTDLNVGAVDPRQAGLAKPDVSRMRSTAGTLAHVTPSAMPALQSAPRTGTMKNLVVLVNFSDLTVAYSRQAYDDLFNQIGYNADGAAGSVKDFYREISYNALTVDSTVVEAVTLNKGYAYYGANDSSGHDLRPRTMVQDALAKLEQRGFDFNTVDADSDGWVDDLTIIHAGGGEEYGGNNSNYIWSHQGNLTSPVTYDNVSMQMYHTEPARRGWDAYPFTQGITRIGVICHESGHFLGLPDLYDYGNDSKGAGDFCLMALGSWNGNYGTRPAHMSAWCKSALSWVTPTVITATNTYPVSQVETNQQIYKLQGTFANNEYFLIENRQGVGFDASLPGSLRGILIWHIDENVSNNNDQNHYKVDLEEASGTQHLALNQNDGNDSDYYRSGNNTSFTSSTTPSNLSYAGGNPCIEVTGVGATGSMMTFNVKSLPAAPISAGVDRGSVCVDDSGDISLSAAGGSGTTLKWYSGSCGGTPVGSGTPLSIASPTATTTYYALWESACGNSSCASVTVNVMPLSVAPAYASVDRDSFCEDDSGDVSLTAIGGSGTTLNWYTGSCGGTLAGSGTPLSIASPTETTTYYARWEGACGDSSCASVMVSVLPLPVAPTSANVDRDSFCEDDNGDITLTVTGGSGTTLKWYSDSCGGTLVGSRAPLSIASPTETTTYYARWESTCGDSACATVQTIVSQLPTPATVGGPQTVRSSQTTSNLGGNTPTVGIGAWSIASGGAGTFNPDDTAPTATFTHSGGAGPIVLRWTISTPLCMASSADVTITIDDVPPTVSSIVPADNAPVNTGITSVDITFSEPVTQVAAGDLTVNDSPATVVSGGDAGPYTFSGFAPPANGIVSFVLQRGAIQDVPGNLLAAEYSWSCGKDTDGQPPSVHEVAPAENGSLNALSSITVTFTEYVSGVTSDDLTVNSSPATNVAGTGPGPYVFSGFELPADGTVTVALSDSGGILDLWSQPFAGSTWHYFVDKSPPTGTISIDNDAEYTTSPSVILALSASDGGGSGIWRMRFSSDGSNWGDWEAYALSKSWALTSPEGLKTSYVQFEDNTGNVSSSFSDTITLTYVASDLDKDGDVDENDRALFSQCRSGTSLAHNGSETCQHADLDDDGDVDQSDFGLLQRCYSGVGIPAALDCAHP